MQIENKESFIPDNPKIAIVTVISPQIPGHKTVEETNHSLYELKQLLKTLHFNSIKEYIQSIKKIDAGHVIGEGKIQEIQKDVSTIGFNLLVFDIELSASQHRNIQEATGLTVVDRNMIILEIFARHARSKDAKMQIEIAKLEYVLPRIHSVWYHQDRGGGGPGMRSGQGETAKELEKRAIKERIAHYKKESSAIETNLTEQRKKRDENTYLAALVGYTNAGKSSLMNRLCHEEVLEEDKLFATVDAVYRAMSIHFKPPILLIDTVGFISNLPTQLVKGFRTTLASVLEAHYLIIVSDISHVNCKEQLMVTFEVLKDLKAMERPSIIVFNKKDRMHENERAPEILKEFPNHLLVSSFDESDVERIKQQVVNYFQSVQKNYHLMIPYTDGYAHAKIMELGNIIGSQNCEDGIKYHISVNPSFVHSEIVSKYKIGTN